MREKLKAMFMEYLNSSATTQSIASKNDIDKVAAEALLRIGKRYCAEDDVTGIQDLSSEAHDVLKGMVAHCLRYQIAMGMDEGFVNRLTGEEHPFVSELRKFAEM